jgi:hypothetical protein
MEKYYFYAPDENTVYLVGDKWEEVQLYLTTTHDKWFLLREWSYTPKKERGDKIGDQTVIIDFETYYAKCTHKITIPHDVKEVDCCSDEFKAEMASWEKKHEEWASYYESMKHRARSTNDMEIRNHE